MKRTSGQSGFAHLGLLLLIFAVSAVIGFVGFKVIKQNQGKPVSTNLADDKLELQNVGLANMESVLVTEDALREYDSMGLKGFYPFGDKLGGKTDTRINPNFEFASLKEGTEVISALDGVVAFIKEQPGSGDSEVFIQPKDGSMWTVGYDHITSVVVQKGQAIKAGAVIGKPARQGNGALRFEIQVNRDQASTTTHVCPSTLLASAVKDTVLGELAAMQQEWNTTTGRELYNIAAQNPVGCLKTTMSVNEAEGRP